MSAGPSTTRVEGLVAALDGSTLVVAGTSGKTKVAIAETTSIIKLETASLDDISAGKWMEAEGERAQSLSPMKATSVRIADDPILLVAEQARGPGAPPDGSMGDGGPGGGPPAGGSKPESSDRTAPCLGKVKSVDGRMVVLSMMGPQSKSDVSVLVEDAATISKLSKATLEELSPEARVIVVAEKGRSGNLEARSIEIE
jgi:hypothetical protein